MDSHSRLPRKSVLRAMLATLWVIVVCPLVAADVEDGQVAYERGDYVGAFEQWQAAATAGNIDAQYALGALYSRGQGVARNHELANRWYLKAARGGQVEAQYRLGVRYQTGDGLPRDLPNALAWFSLAAQNGHRKAPSAARRLEQRMSSADRARARQALNKGRSGSSNYASSADQALTRKIQAHLRLLGYDAGAIDGVAGSQTKRALKQYQRDAGLSATGRISHDALTALRASLSTQRGGTTRSTQRGATTRSTQRGATTRSTQRGATTRSTQRGATTTPK